MRMRTTESLMMTNKKSYRSKYTRRGCMRRKKNRLKSKEQNAKDEDERKKDDVDDVPVVLSRHEGINKRPAARYT